MAREIYTNIPILKTPATPEGGAKAGAANNGPSKLVGSGSSGSTLSREEWISQCAAVFIRVAGMPEKTAGEYAESQLENLNDDLTEDPEQAAHDEMSYWASE